MSKAKSILHSSSPAGNRCLSIYSSHLSLNSNSFQTNRGRKKNPKPRALFILFYFRVLELSKLPKPAAMESSLFLKLSYIPLLLLLSSLIFLALSDGFLKSTIHPLDVLPLLPRRASWPILRSLHSAVDLLPTFVGAASSSNSTLEWKGACFYENEAWLEFHNNSGSQFGGGTLHIKVFHF